MFYLRRIIYFLFIFQVSSLSSLTFGYASGENLMTILDKFDLFLSYLSDELGENIEFIQTETYSETQAGFINGALDIGILNALSYLELESSGAITPLAQRYKNGTSLYSSYILVRADSPIDSIKDLKGTTFAFGDPDSTSSTFIPNQIFLENHIDPQQDLKHFFYIPKQDSILFAILNRTVEAGAVASFIFNEQDKALQSHLKIIKKSSPFPLGPFVANSHLDQNLLKKIKKILLEMPYNEKGLKALEKSELEKFSDFNDQDFDFLREYKVNF